MPPELTIGWYSSVTGVVAATIFGVAILKRAIGGVSYLNTVPTWLYAVSLASGLIFVTNRIWGTLPGDLWQNMWQAVTSAGMASGFYEWLNRPTSSLAASAVKANVLVPSANMPTRDVPKATEEVTVTTEVKNDP